MKAMKTKNNTKNPAKSYTPHKHAHFAPVPDSKRDEINWNAKMYRDRELSFYASASFTEASKPVVTKMTKTAKKALIKQGVAKAVKVRHFRPQLQVSQSSFVMVGGIPHKMKDGQLVPMVTAAKSKNWVIVEPKAKKKKKPAKKAGKTGSKKKRK
jgi:hypothetical protein